MVALLNYVQFAFIIIKPLINRVFGKCNVWQWIEAMQTFVAAKIMRSLLPTTLAKWWPHTTAQANAHKRTAMAHGPGLNNKYKSLLLNSVNNINKHN